MRIDATGFARAQRRITSSESETDIGDIVLERGSEVVVTMPAKSNGSLARIDLADSWLEVDMLTAAMHDGTAVIRSVPAGEHTATVINGHSIVCEKRITVPNDGSRVDVTCTSPSHVTGQVLLGNAPASGGSLSWSRVGRVMTEGVISNTVTDRGTRRQEVYGGGAGMAVAPVESNGRFSIDDLLPGEWDVTWWSASGASVKPRRVTIPDTPTAEITLRYDASVVSGIVIDNDGKPVASARVQTAADHFTFSNDEGAFTLAGLAPGRYTLQARKGAIASRALDVVVEGNDPLTGLQLKLDPSISDAVRVQVIAANGEPAANAFVFVHADLGVRIVTTDAAGEGEAVFAAGRPANVRLAGFAHGAWTFDVVDARASTQVLKVGSVGALRITSTQSGVPQLLTSNGLDVVWMMSRLGLPASLSPNAPMLISGLPPGRYTLVVGGNARMVDVRASDTTDVRVE